MVEALGIEVPFEPSPFSGTFSVCCWHRSLARTLIDPPLQHHLMTHPPSTFAVKGCWVVTWDEKRLRSEDLGWRLAELGELADLLSARLR